METFKERNYKKEYQNYHSKPEQKKRRAGRNHARRQLKDTKGIVGKDVHHKDGNPLNNDKSNLSIVTQKYNRTEPRLREEDNPRIPRKKGQPANSKKHSDLYTDENPKGTIHGLKFATVKDAEASVRKIKSSGRKHAHKVQAAVAMEQRAKAAGKKSAAAVYRRYINSVKKSEADLHSKLSRGHKPDYYQLGTSEFKPFDKSRDDVEENFADGKKPGRKGISKRVGIPKGASLTQLAKLAKAKGEKGRMARWQLNMRRGKKKKKSS